MAKKLKNGDEVYAGYPTVQLYDFKRNDENKLTFGKVKQLLWGDWIRVQPHSPKVEIKTPEEQSYFDEKIQGMIQVKVRGESGYMYRHDLEENRLLEVVFVDVGQGDGSLLVTPDDKKYIIDAGVSDNMYRYLNWRFSEFKKARNDFDGIIITHPDNDHYKGFNLIVKDQEVRVSNIWHNGLMEQFDLDENGKQNGKRKSLGHSKIENGQKYIYDLMETDQEIGSFLNNELRWIKQASGRPKEYPKLIHTAFTAKTEGGERRFPNISMLSSIHGEIYKGKSYLPGFTPNKNDCVIEIIGPMVEIDAEGKKRLRVFDEEPDKNVTRMDIGKTKNGHSILLKLSYKNMTLFFGGDLNSSAEMFLLDQKTDLDVYEKIENNPEEIVEKARETFECDITKACHHGSADFMNVFLQSLNPAATVISSGDNESHAHPRSDTLGAIGRFGRGERSLIFSTELARSTSEYTEKENSPWAQALKYERKAYKENDPVKKKYFLDKSEELVDRDKTLNVTVYGSINLRSDGEKVVMAYMLERPSKTKKWDVYTLEPDKNGQLQYRPVDKASDAKKKRLKAFNKS